MNFSKDISKDIIALLSSIYNFDNFLTKYYIMTMNTTFSNTRAFRELELLEANSKLVLENRELKHKNTKLTEDIEILQKALLDLGRLYKEKKSDNI